MALQAMPADALEEERQLVESAKSGNLDAMRPIFEKYAQPLYASVLMPKLGDTVVAEDLLRDTMATAVQKLHTFEWSGRSIFFWLRQIAANKAYDHHRKNKRSRKLIEAVTHEAASQPQSARAADVALIAREEQLESRRRIEATLGKLNPRYQRALRMRLIEEKSREECAEALDVSVSTFDVVFFRASKAFRKQFGERGLENDSHE